jgi:hypothetical protein
MQLLFRLPFLLIETIVRRGLRALLGLTGAAREAGAEDVAPVTAPAPPPSPAARVAPRAPTGPPTPTAEEAIARRVVREAESANSAAAAADAPASARPRPIRPTPHVDRDAEVVESFGPAEDVAGTIDVDEPWEGYDGMPATTIVTRLRGADPATKGVVRLYEQRHKRRATVLRATG